MSIPLEKLNDATPKSLQHLSFLQSDFQSLVKINVHLTFNHSGLLYISTSVWVLHTPNAGKSSHFQHILSSV